MHMDMNEMNYLYLHTSTYMILWEGRGGEGRGGREGGREGGAGEGGDTDVMIQLK